MFSSHEPDSFTSTKFYPSMLLPASHRFGLIATMSQLTPHTTLVLGFPHNGLYPSLPIFPIGLYEVSLGKTIYFHHMPTLVHYTPKYTSSSYFIHILHRISPVLEWVIDCIMLHLGSPNTILACDFVSSFLYP